MTELKSHTLLEEDILRLLLRIEDIFGAIENLKETFKIEQIDYVELVDAPGNKHQFNPNYLESMEDSLHNVYEILMINSRHAKKIPR